MTRFLSLVILAMTLTLSCKNRSADAENDIKTIDVAGGVGKGKVVQLSEIAESIEYIPLETNRNSMIDKVSWSSLVFENNKYYIRTRFEESIFVFDSVGKFLFKFNRTGRGPEEYEYLAGFTVDPDGNIIIRSVEKFVLYDKEGNFVRVLADKNTFPEITFDKCLPFGDDKYLFTKRIKRGVDNEYSAILMDYKSNKILKIKYPSKEREFVKSLPMMYRFSFYEVFAVRSNEGMLIFNGLDENILRVDRDFNIDTIFRINFGKYHPRDIPGEVLARADVSSNIFRYVFPFESSRYIFDQFNLGAAAHKPRIMLKHGAKSEDDIVTFDISCSLFDKITGEFLLVDQPEKNQIGFPDDFEGGPAVWPVYVSTCNHIVTSIDAMNFITYSETHKVSDKYLEIAGRLKETDNPVMVLVKLKN
jgi:hypothetical protein